MALVSGAFLKFMTAGARTKALAVNRTDLLCRTEWLVEQILEENWNIGDWLEWGEKKSGVPFVV